MSTYVIGDVQGCFKDLKALLALIQFSPEQDTLWFAGDVVNRGPDSLSVLRYIMQLPRVISVLGNHEFHLLALAEGLFPEFNKHTVQAILQAPDRDKLLDWVRSRPLLHYDAHFNATMTHAGVFPAWSLSQAKRYANEIEHLLRDKNTRPLLLKHLYGDAPSRWDESLTKWDRARFIINSFTRMRYVTQEGALDFHCTGAIGTQPSGLLPWFDSPHRAMAGELILFGHWASLRGSIDRPDVQALDGGCVWGNTLIAKRLDDGKRFHVRSSVKKV